MGHARENARIARGLEGMPETRRCLDEGELSSVAGGVLGGLAVVFLSVMTFSGTGWVEFAVGWILGSILLFTYAYPVWRGLRNMEARGVRQPMWIVMGGSVIVVSGAALMFVFER